MRNPFAKITISVMIVLTLLSTQILLPLQASAENKFLNYNDPNKDGNNPPFKLNFGNVTPQLLTSVVSCTNLQNKIAAKLLVVNDTIKKELDKLVKKALAEVQKALISKAKRKVTSRH